MVVMMADHAASLYKARAEHRVPTLVEKFPIHHNIVCPKWTRCLTAVLRRPICSLKCRSLLRRAPDRAAGGREAVPHFVPSLYRKPLHLVVIGKGSRSPVLGQRINAIANHHTQYQR